MTRLNEDARIFLMEYPVERATETDWARFWQAGDPEWGGDECGCPDDRCIGHHHLADEPCMCIRALLSEYETATREAAEIWERHRSGDPGAIEAGEKWVRERCDYGLTGWTFDVTVDGEAGIAITRDDAPQWQLLWSAERADQ